jgi:predicted dehydrogenase
MKIVIAGLGSIGRRHFRNLRTLGEQDILLYRSHLATLPDDELGGFLEETDFDSVLAWRPDAVVVSNPTALHMDIAIPAAEAGCHIFLEKPISHSLERVDELKDAVKRGGGKIFVGFQFRFHPGLLKIVQLLQDGAVGQPLAVHAHWGEYLPNWHPWEDYKLGYAARADLGGGVILTLCHPLDYLRWLFGEVQSVSAFAAKSGGLNIPVEDLAEISMQFSSGVIGSVHLNYWQRPSVHRLEIIGTQGTIRWDNSDGAALLAQIGQTSTAGDWQAFLPPVGFERNHMFMDEMAHFLAVARGEAEPVCTLEDGIQALHLAQWAYESAANGVIVKATGRLEK